MSETSHAASGPSEEVLSSTSLARKAENPAEAELLQALQEDIGRVLEFFAPDSREAIRARLASVTNTDRPGYITFVLGMGTGFDRLSQLGLGLLESVVDGMHKSKEGERLTLEDFEQAFARATQLAGTPASLNFTRREMRDQMRWTLAQKAAEKKD